MKLKFKVLLIITNFISSIFVFNLLFGINNSLVDINNLYSNLKDDYIYITDGYRIYENIDDVIYYEKRVVDKDNKKYNVIFMHSSAIEFGIPYYEYSYIKINDKSLSNGFYSNTNEEGFNYINLSIPNFNNTLTQRNYSTDIYICIDDNFEFVNPSNAIIKDNNQNRKEIYYQEDFINPNRSTGLKIKNYYKDVYRSSMIPIYLIIYVPCLLIIGLLANFTTLIINSDYQYYKINQLFFKKKNEMINNFFKIEMGYITISLLSSSFIAELIFRIDFIRYLIYLICTYLIFIIVNYLSIKKSVKKFYKNKMEMEEIR